MAASATMANAMLLLILLLLHSHVTPSFAASGTNNNNNNNKRTYIVHMARSRMPTKFQEHTHWFEASLASVSPRAPEMLYTYATAAHGFAARLTESEAAALASKAGVAAVLPETRYELQTTRTPEFLGLARETAGFVPQTDSTSDVVVGVLDTGAWPESKSYDDSGFGPVPPTWKGMCEEGKGFTASKACNKKLIGARFFSKGYESNMGPIDETRESRSPRDDDGHGTHTSTTAAGSVVQDASLFGFAPGTARGMAPRARVAVYKVCWVGGCFSSDILAALDKAVEDGVNVLSLSLGGGQSDYFRDSVAIGAFGAMEKGVFVSSSAGNAGPGASTLSNVAPWITTVGAGTLDRDFPAYIMLGNGNNYTGVSLYSGKPLDSTPTVPFIYAGNATNSSTGRLCMTGTLIPEKVKGKIVLCDRGISARVQKGYVVKEAGGVGMVLANTASNGEELVADAHLLPAAGVGQKTGETIKSYLFSTDQPTATILISGTKVGIKPSPVVAAFSSRGPNSVTPEILKPDLVAPGVNILAGWSGAIGPTGLGVDPRRTEYNIISGTSMSCPHVSGLAALLKQAHPDWSPAVIKSALMTTAYSSYPGDTGAGAVLDVATGKAATAFDLGAGHVDPVRALDPGLVYDITPEEYIGFLCALNYTSLQIGAISRTNSTCDTGKKYSVYDLNYPSFSVTFPSSASSGSANGTSNTTTTTLKHTRTVTNVGASGTYKATVTGLTADDGLQVSVDPNELAFTSQGEKQTYTVTFTAGYQQAGTSSFARLEWSDGKHVVGSPIAVTWGS